MRNIKGVVSIKGKDFVNLTAHAVDLVDGLPASLDAKKVDDTVEIFETLNGRFEDVVETKDGICYTKREFKIDLDEVKKILIKIRNEVGDSTNLIVSLPVLLNGKEKIESLASAIGMDVVVVGVIQATKRGVYPPVACKYHWAV